MATAAIVDRARYGFPATVFSPEAWARLVKSFTLEKAVDASFCHIRDAANRGTDTNFRRLLPEFGCLYPVCPPRRHPGQSLTQWVVAFPSTTAIIGTTSLPFWKFNCFF